jgi:dihydroxy-acid dehydratase
LNSQLLEELKDSRSFSYENMIAMVRHNTPELYESCKHLEYDELFDVMVKEGILKISIIISGQGPVAFGMPEMFTPMQHINASRKLKRLATLISDGRYSGVTYGAAVGHMTPEAEGGGGILYLQTGDLLYLDFLEGSIQFLDQEAFSKGEISFSFETIKSTQLVMNLVKNV